MNQTYTLVIPTYNESAIIKDTLKEVISAFSSSKVPWKIIVADNASSDNTAGIVRNINDPRVGVIELKEKGRGRAIRQAFSSVKNSIVGFTDADLPIDPRDVLKGFDMIHNGECEIVVGTRFGKESDASTRTWLRRGSSIIFHVLAKVIVNLHASDSQCPLKIMNDRTKPIMLATSDPTWWSELEFILLAEKMKIPMKELPIVWNDSKYPKRKSTIKVVKDGFNAIGAMFKMRSALPKQLAKLKEEMNTYGSR